MTALRIWIHGNRLALIALCLLALSVRALVPAGYMVARPDAPLTLTMTICNAASAAQATVDIVLPVKRDTGGHPGNEAPKQSDCAFSSLIGGALVGADLFQIAALIAFILTLAFRPLVRVPARQSAFLYPQTRAPPVRS